MTSSQTPSSVDRLFDDLFDYAGLFPPAALTMHGAVQKFSAYVRDPQQGLLNQFVLPVSRLEEFRIAMDSLGLPDDGWMLSILSADWKTERPLVQAFQRTSSRARITSVETKQLNDVEDLAEDFQNIYVELPIGEPNVSQQKAAQQLEHSVMALREHNAFAKIRTGGLTEISFPSCDLVAKFLWLCCRESVPFKATAGLHHPVRSHRAVSCAPNAVETLMHGFVNVLAATSVATEGASEGEIAEVLEIMSAGRLFGKEDSILNNQSPLHSVRQLFHSIGSCSFEEPVTDLQQLNWLSDPLLRSSLPGTP